MAYLVNARNLPNHGFDEVTVAHRARLLASATAD